MYVCNTAIIEGGVEVEKDITKSILNKIGKIAVIFSEASADEKPKILAQIKEKLKTAAAQSFGTSGNKYVDIIMQGVKLKAMNSTINVSIANSKSQRNFDETSENTVERGEHLVKSHVIKTITDKIESFAKKYLMNLNTIEEKRIFLDNVGKKMLQMAELKKIKTSSGDVINYNNIITKSINDILKRNLQQNSRRVMSNIEDSTANEKQSIEIMDNNVEFNKLNTDCIVSTAMICVKVNYLNKFTCRSENKSIYIGKICDGIKDCSDGTDENECRRKAIITLNRAKTSLFEMNQSFEQNCLLGKFNESIKQQMIIRDWIKAQIDVIDDDHDIFQYNNVTKSKAEHIKKVVDILNKIILNLNKGICSRQKKSSGILDSAQMFHRILDKNLEGILRDSALFPKSCICKGELCVSRTCVKSCENACKRKYNLGRWSCPGVNGSTSVHLDEICDGKLDCYDESDERKCNIGKGRGKFDAIEGFAQIIKILEMKMASKEYAHVRNELLRLYNSIISLQHLISESNFRIREIKVIRGRCFKLLSLIYGNFMKNSYNSNDAEGMYKFLNSVNQVLVQALKASHTGNTKIILTYDCICRNNRCIKPKCSAECVLACEVENKLGRYYCKKSPENRSVPVEAICDSKKDCEDGDDEAECNGEVCRRHHLYILRTHIQDVGNKYHGSLLGEALKFWRMKATSMLLVAEKMGRRSPQFFRLIIKDMIKDLIHVYASYAANRKKGAKTTYYEEFSEISKNVMKALRYCGK